MLFSVIVPVYNGEKYLERCLRSIADQTFTDFELLIIDDGSTDKSGKIADAFSAGDHRIRVIHQKNHGLCASRRRGIFSARGEYIVYVDADDYVESDLLAEVADKINSYPGIDMVVYDAAIHKSDGIDRMDSGAPEGYYDREAIRSSIIPEVIQGRHRGLGEGIILQIPWNRAYRTSLLKAHYCRDEMISLGEDAAFTFECVIFAESIYVLHRELYHFDRSNESSMTAGYVPDLADRLMRMIRYISGRLPYDPEIRAQLSSFIASKIVIIFRNELCHNSFFAAAGKAGKSLRKSGILDLIRLSDFRHLSPAAAIYILLLKHHMYLTAALITRLRLRIR